MAQVGMRFRSGAVVAERELLTVVLDGYGTSQDMGELP